MSVGFQLENEFHIANGQMEDSKTLFNREARLFVKGAFGELAAGRVGSLGSASGSYDMFFANGDAFDGGDQVGTGFVVSDKLNNSLTYVSPNIAGAQVYAQYSFSTVDAQKDKFNKNSRQWGLGATFTMDNFAVAGLVEQTLPVTDGVTTKPAKPITLGLGANVTLDNLKLFGAVQYAKHIKEVNGVTDTFKFANAKNVAGTLGATYTMGQNEFTVAGYLGHAKEADVAEKATYMSLNGRYVYNLSARTSLYAGADYARLKSEVPTNTEVTKTHFNTFTVYTGLHHTF